MITNNDLRDVSKDTLSLPVFPLFKPLSLDDKNIIETHVSKHAPYSDFNFLSLFSWNVDGKTAVSTLNDNLVVRLKDYLKDDFVYTFLGKNQVKDSIKSILGHLKDTGACAELKLIPEVVIGGENDLLEHCLIQEDPDQHDYIYDVEAMSEMLGGDYQKKRNLYKRFMRENQYKIERIDISDANIQQAIKELFINWAEIKMKSVEDYQDELKALQNCFIAAQYHNIHALGIFINDGLVGFSINELFPNGYGLMHFEKTKQNYVGVTEFLIKETAAYYKKMGIKYMNMFQDIGLDSLRTSKTLWRPVSFLKKYRISLKQ